MSVDWRRVKQLFEHALAQPAPLRAAAVDAADADTAVRAEVRSLLAHAADAEAAGLLERPALADAAPVWPPGCRVGAWVVAGLLGQGGMGEVLRARRADGAYDAEAAIKVLKRGMDSSALLARFAQEQRALARLNHPHIARLFDAGIGPDQRPYFVMELVEGRPIDRAVQGLPVADRLRLFLQLADAVAYAHRQLLVHRDLKPSNVLVDGRGQVKLLDFGIAKALDATEEEGQTTLAGQRPFTPIYASPEQVRGEPVSTATDLYSLGVLLYLVLTGRRPYGRGAATPADAARCVLEEEPTRPSALPDDAAADPDWPATRRHLRGDLDNIVLKALEKPVERRYATVDALAEDLRAYLAGYPVSARAAHPAYLARKFVARHRWAVLAGGLGGLGLATGLAAALLHGQTATALSVAGLAGGLTVALFKGRESAVARDLASARLAETRAIARDVMVRHADSIHYLPGGLALKSELLRNMLDHLNRLAMQAPEDQALGCEQAAAYARLAELQSDNQLASTGEVAASDANAARAIALFERHARPQALPAETAMWWARAWSTRALAARARGDATRALACQAERIDVMRRALEGHPDDTDLLSEIGSAHLLRGQLFDTTAAASLGRPDDALRELDAAEAVYRQLLDNPRRSADDESTARHQLGTIEGSRMLCHFNAGRADEALAAGERALAWRALNASTHPDHVGMRSATAGDAGNLGACCIDAGDPARGLAHLEHADALLAALMHEDPTLDSWPRWRTSLGLHRGRALVELGRAAEAVAPLRALAGAAWLAEQAAGRRRIAHACLVLARAQAALGHADDALAAAVQAIDGLQRYLGEQPADVDAWLLLAQARRLRAELGAGAGADPAAWRVPVRDAVEHARAVRPLNPLQQRTAARLLA